MHDRQDIARLLATPHYRMLSLSDARQKASSATHGAMHATLLIQALGRSLQCSCQQLTSAIVRCQARNSGRVIAINSATQTLCASVNAQSNVCEHAARYALRSLVHAFRIARIASWAIYVVQIVVAVNHDQLLFITVKHTALSSSDDVRRTLPWCEQPFAVSALLLIAYILN